MPTRVRKPAADYAEIRVIRRWLLHHNHPLFHRRVELCFESGQTTLAAKSRTVYHLLCNFISVLRAVTRGETAAPITR